jgi:hypothetical protein
MHLAHLNCYLEAECIKVEDNDVLLEVETIEGEVAANTSLILQETGSEG